MQAKEHAIQQKTSASSDRPSKRKRANLYNTLLQELTYKEIADKMEVKRTVDGYRESVFSKLDLRSRTGIVLLPFITGWLVNTSPPAVPEIFFYQLLVIRLEFRGDGLVLVQFGLAFAQILFQSRRHFSVVRLQYCSGAHCLSCAADQRPGFQQSGQISSCRFRVSSEAFVDDVFFGLVHLISDLPKFFGQFAVFGIATTQLVGQLLQGFPLRQLVAGPFVPTADSYPGVTGFRTLAHLTFHLLQLLIELFLHLLILGSSDDPPGFWHHL